jgi:hypothetical protein
MGVGGEDLLKQIYYVRHRSPCAYFLCLRLRRSFISFSALLPPLRSSFASFSPGAAFFMSFRVMELYCVGGGFMCYVVFVDGID